MADALAARAWFLRTLPHFGALDEATLREAAASLCEETFAPGAVVFVEGDPARDLYLLQAGRVEITVRGGDPESPPVRVMEAPGSFGELSLLGQGPRTATVTALTPVAVWRLPGDIFDRLFDRHPAFARALVRMLCARIQAKDREFLDQSALALAHARVSRELEEKKRQLEAVSTHKSAFLARMGHELRTPLHAIIGFAEVLLDETVRSSEAERREFVEHIVRGGKHLLGIVNEVLDLSRIEAGRMELRRCPLAVADLVDEVAVTVRPLAEEKRIHVARDVGPGLPAAWADPARVRQVLMNLVGNALKFTPAGGRVVLGARAAANGTGMGRWIEVSVADTGIGIPPEEHDRIFEEFQQVPGVEGEDQGTGLGLALAKRIVELHGGAIRVLSAPGRGSTFAFTLPTVTPA